MLCGIGGEAFNIPRKSSGSRKLFLIACGEETQKPHNCAALNRLEAGISRNFGQHHGMRFGDPTLSDDATHRFIATVQRAQPGTRVLDLGTQEEILAKVGAGQLDPVAIQAIGKAYGVAAVLSGNVAMKSPRTQVQVASLSSVSATAKVDASMQATLRETDKGATIWTNGASGTWKLSSVEVSGRGVGARSADPVRKHAQIMAELVQITTEDFRSTWGRQRIAE